MRATCLRNSTTSCNLRSNCLTKALSRSISLQTTSSPMFTQHTFSTTTYSCRFLRHNISVTITRSWSWASESGIPEPTKKILNKSSQMSEWPKARSRLSSKKPLKNELNCSIWLWVSTQMTSLFWTQTSSTTLPRLTRAVTTSRSDRKAVRSLKRSNLGSKSRQLKCFPTRCSKPNLNALKLWLLTTSSQHIMSSGSASGLPQTLTLTRSKS